MRGWPAVMLLCGTLLSVLPTSGAFQPRATALAAPATQTCGSVSNRQQSPLCQAQYIFNAQSMGPRRRGTICTGLPPRSAYPTGMIHWTSDSPHRNAGALVSGLQDAQYRWGYALLTVDVYPDTDSAHRHYQYASQLLHGDRKVRTPRIGHETVVWETHDQITGYLVTTILLRAYRTVAVLYVGAPRPALATARHIARSVAAHACR